MKSNNFKNKEIISNPNGDAFSYSVYNNDSFKKFCELKEDKTTKPIDAKDLPSEFDEGLCNFINLFRRKTVNEKTEWEFYIDYENNEIIHCLHGKSTVVSGFIHSALMEKRKIVTIHNHIKGTYSAPSSENFEILEHEFEDFEIICAENEYWILKANGKFNREWIRDVKREIYDIFKRCDGLGDSFEGINSNELYEKELEIFINNLKSDITLTKKEYKEHG